MGIKDDEQRAHAIMATVNHLPDKPGKPGEVKLKAIAEARRATDGIPDDKIENGGIGARIDKTLEKVQTANPELRNNNNFNPVYPRASALLQQRDFNQQNARNASPPALQQQRETPKLGLPSNHHTKTL